MICAHNRLRVVGLEKTLRGPILHDPRLGVGEVALGLRGGRRVRRVRERRRPALRRPAGLGHLAGPLSQRGLRGVRCLNGSRGRLRLQGRFGLPDLGEAALPAGQFGGQRVPASAWAVLRVLRSIDGSGLREKRRDLALQRLLGLTHPAVTHRLVLGGIGQDLGPVEGHVSQAHQPGPLTELQHLAEQPREGWQVALPKGGQAVMIGMLVGRQDPVRNLLVGRPLNLARGRLAHRRTPAT